MIDLEFLLEEDLLYEGFFNNNDVSAIRNAIDKSNYDKNNYIKIGSGSVECKMTEILSMNDHKLYNYCNNTSITDIKNDFKKSNQRKGFRCFTEIEQLEMNGINNRSTLMKYLKDQDQYRVELDDYSSKVQNYLKDKTLIAIIIFNSEGDTILYCKEDDCCYVWIGSEEDNIEKVTIQQVLQASKFAYNDLLKIIK